MSAFTLSQSVSQRVSAAPTDAVASEFFNLRLLEITAQFIVRVLLGQSPSRSRSFGSTHIQGQSSPGQVSDLRGQVEGLNPTPNFS